MGIDIRTPIGIMFVTFGLMLTGFGIFGSKSIYASSGGFNINLFWGLALLIFGAIMWFLGARNPGSTDSSGEAPSSDSHQRTRGH